MSKHLVVAYHPPSDHRIVEWVSFRSADGVDDFHFVVPAGEDRAEQRLAFLMDLARRPGATVTGELSTESALGVTRRVLRTGDASGVIMAIPPEADGWWTRRAIRQLETRHDIGVVHVRPDFKAPLLRPGQPAPAPVDSDQAAA